MRRILSVLSITLLLGLVLVPARTFAFDPFGTVCDIGGADSAVCQEKNKNATDPLTGQKGLFRGVTNIIAGIAGVAAVVVMIVAGIKFATSGGDAAKTKSAKETLTFALIGIVVIVLADSLVTFVLGKI